MFLLKNIGVELSIFKQLIFGRILSEAANCIHSEGSALLNLSGRPHQRHQQLHLEEDSGPIEGSTFSGTPFTNVHLGCSPWLHCDSRVFSAPAPYGAGVPSVIRQRVLLKGSARQCRRQR